MNEQWRQQLREKMADYRRPAPEVSWDAIDQALTARKPRLLWWRRMAAAAVLLLIAGAGYWTLRQEETTAEHTTTAAVVSRPRQAMIAKKAMETMGAMRPMRPMSPMSPIASPDSELADAPVSPDTVAATAQNDEPSSSAVTPHPSPDNRRTHVLYPTDFRRQSHPTNRLTAKVYLSNTMADSRHAESSIQQTSHTAINSHTVTPDNPPGNVSCQYEDSFNHEEGNIGNNYLNGQPQPITVYDTITTVTSSQTDRHVHHRQPVRFGLSLRYRIDNRWSVESGLSYTRLSSDITTSVDGVATVTEQRIDYIGLPLNVGYQLWTSRHFGFYVAAGCTVEKMLDASPWQFSLNGAAGAEYKLTDTFSLYAEPGVGYYFSDGSAIPTVYDDRPFSFNLSFGLRFNLK